ncbi:MAG: threonine synthase [SAR324 cluster bacterium]|nr:threonine synthase [SAR324 cluster bacterium]
MKHKSTRGMIQGLSFEEAVMMGLADDGGLLVPECIPQVQKNFKKWSRYSFPELSWTLMSHFIEDEIPQTDLKELIQRSYSSFNHPEITPVVSIGNSYIAELFHGPTFAFKDIALQFLGNLFEYFLEKNNGFLTIAGATSGDTGSAAIYGLRGKKNVEVFMLYPNGRVSPIQELQMTTVLDSNIHNLAVEGSFDDAQGIVKDLFNNLEFKQKYHLGAVNSINWARILAQIVYYFYAYFRVQPDCESPVNFCVPTGNFGDILAGYYAKKMGLPIAKLTAATNQNDILHRFFSKGEYHQHGVKPSFSPSMDIQISSNFERFLYYLSGENSIQLKDWMEVFHSTGMLSVKGVLLEKAQAEMSSGAVSEEETLATIREYHYKYQYVLDPHTAVGVRIAQQEKSEFPTICLATAHPAKFGDAVKAAIEVMPTLPPSLASLEKQQIRKRILPATTEAVKSEIVQTLK